MILSDVRHPTTYLVGLFVPASLSLLLGPIPAAALTTLRVRTRSIYILTRDILFRARGRKFSCHRSDELLRLHWS